MTGCFVGVGSLVVGSVVVRGGVGVASMGGVGGPISGGQHSQQECQSDLQRTTYHTGAIVLQYHTGPILTKCQLINALKCINIISFDKISLQLKNLSL